MPLAYSRGADPRGAYPSGAYPSGAYPRGAYPRAAAPIPPSRQIEPRFGVSHQNFHRTIQDTLIPAQHYG